MTQKVKILDIDRLVVAIAISRNTINTLIENKAFPAPIQILGKAKRWDVKEIESWMRAKILERNHSPKEYYDYHRPENENKLLRFHSYATLKAEFGVARSSLYVLMRDGGFPHPVKLSARRVGWVESEVIDWFEAQKLKRQML
ncbi:hypothetical protein JCM19231_1715 [Vibrio ishigakensis]|uniref:Uncharacterized protein n=1 Tax=Vibrio ishigakensis TaxID=1481914 RepID=A0A0B8P884_9VIBR|nr:AlpA family phage regulatory protein [Vibrio ishigakensis]GAM59149.1 hypothetical protein JCM19231_1715 [Vibrio ishigakensis]